MGQLTKKKTAPLTETQQKVLDVVREFLNGNAHPPTLAELAGLLHINPNAVRGHLLALDRKHALRYIPNISRGIELPVSKPNGIPIYGYVPAGHPFMSQDNVVDTFEVHRYISASKNVFGLYVRGDSMQDAQIATGDLLFVDPDVEAKSGRMVVALVEGEPTVKWFQKEGTTISLVPANKKYKPIVIDKHDENFKIVGVVVGMMRAIDKKRIDDSLKLRKAS
ncbi:MAG TPA: transcriptional repressor LexA [Bacteroidota bacterium]|nr:transcriptional repressor LexA [Bacteroidota bacterium]